MVLTKTRLLKHDFPVHGLKFWLVPNDAMQGPLEFQENSQILLVLSAILEVSRVYEQSRSYLVFFHALPASTWGHYSQTLIFTLIW